MGNKACVQYGKSDCFAYRIRSCLVLEKKICRLGKCNFHKTTDRFLEDFEKYPPPDDRFSEFIKEVKEYSKK